MAREDTATAESTESESATEQPAGEPKVRKTVSVSVPEPLRGKLLEQVGGEQDKLAGFIRDHLAEYFGVTIPVAQKRQKYATEEEKKAAQTQRRQSRNDLIKQLLAEHEARLAAQNGASA